MLSNLFLIVNIKTTTSITNAIVEEDFILLVIQYALLVVRDLHLCSSSLCSSLLNVDDNDFLAYELQIRVGVHQHPP